MQLLSQPRALGQRQGRRLGIAAAFVENTLPAVEVSQLVPGLHLSVTYDNGQPVVGLESENFSVVNAENMDDLSRLFCITGFVALPIAGGYELAMRGARWESAEMNHQCCFVQVTRIPRSSHTIEIGRAQCCVS